MTRISSNWTVFYKRILPAFWLGLLALWTVIMLGIGRSGDALVHDSRMMIVLPIAMALVGLVVMRKLLFSCADEVHDLGDALLVRRGGREATIRFEEIESVRSAALIKPPRITLRLARPTEVGSEVTFIADRDTIYQPFTRSRIAIELERRAQDARAAVRAE